MTASFLLKQNIKAILKARGQTAHELAIWCRMDDSWISKILSDKPEDKARGVPVRHLDRIASFFGVQVYQLFQPGISPLAERRVTRDRRAGRDRRISAAVLSEKPGDVDLIHLVRALSPAGRQEAIGLLVDLVNDELRPLRSRGASAVASDRTAEKPPVTRARKSRGKP